MVTFVGATGGTTANNGPTITLHEDIQAGDLLVMLLGVNSPAYTHSLPPGWVQLDKANSTGGSAPPYTVLMWKTAASADAGSQVQVPVSPTGSKQAICVAAYRGTLLTPQIDVFGIEVPSTDSEDLAFPSLSTTQDDAILVLGGVRKSSTTPHNWVTPTGATERAFSTASGGGAISAILADMPQDFAGAISVDPWTTTGISNSAGSASIVAIYEGEPPELKKPVFRRMTQFGWYPPREGTESPFFS